MKTRTLPAIAFVLSAATATPALSASAMISTGNLAVDVQSAVGGGGHVNVSLEDGVATLTGYVENSQVADSAVFAARRHGDVREVIDLMFES